MFKKLKPVAVNTEERRYENIFHLAKHGAPLRGALDVSSDSREF